MNKNILIDGNNLLHRANYVVDTTCPDPNVQLIYNTLNILSNWITSIDNFQYLAFFIDGVPVRRRALYPQYKVKIKQEGQKSLSDVMNSKLSIPILFDGQEVTNQQQMLLCILSLLGIDVFYHMEEEADDLIASCVKLHSKDLNIIISSDTDFYPLLVKYPTTVLYKPDMSGNRFFDSERAEGHLLKKFGVRVPLSKIETFKGFVGDASDNIIGVPRLRKKVAAELCNLGSIDDILKSGIPFASKVEKDKILRMGEIVKLNIELIKLIDTIDIESMKMGAKPDYRLADSIIKSNIKLSGFPTYAFRTNTGTKIRISDAIDTDPDYAWLKDI